MSQQQKLEFLPLILKDNAEQFFFDELEQLNNWGEVLRIMNYRYNGQARKRSIVDELCDMTLHDFIDDNITAGEALQKMARRIERLVPQCPPGKNTDSDKRDMLFYAVRMFDWAQQPITTLAGSNKSCKEFLDELATAEQNQCIKETLQGQPRNRSKANRKRGFEQLPKFGAGSSNSNGAAAIWSAGQAPY